jgi:hypothetical protein
MSPDPKSSNSTKSADHSSDGAERSAVRHASISETSTAIRRKIAWRSLWVSLLIQARRHFQAAIPPTWVASWLILKQDPYRQNYHSDQSDPKSDVIPPVPWLSLWSFVHDWTPPASLKGIISKSGRSSNKREGLRCSRRRATIVGISRLSSLNGFWSLILEFQNVVAAL